MDAEPPVTHFADIPRWSNTLVPDYSKLLPNVYKDCRSPFTCNTTVNSKVAYWTGDISTLDTHAVVACNNENFTDNDVQTTAILGRAGPELRKELMQSVKGCRTGEAKLTKSYELPSRYVIHTVGPRYNLKYKTAAESALFCCYRNILMLLREHQIKSLGLRCVHTTRRGYPTVDGAHIAIRTVRRFLEKHADEIDVIIFVLTGSERETYSSLFPLYFPRNAEEEAFASRNLPRDIGNEDGEPVIAERQIRISANPAMANAGEVENSDEDDGPDMSDMLGTNLSVGEHAFAKMEADVDKQKLQNRHSDISSASNADLQRISYERLLKQSRLESFTELAALRFLYQSGFSKSGETVVVYIARNVPASNNSARKVLLYAINQLDNVVSKPYIFVYVHSDSASEMATACFKRIFAAGDFRYRNNLQALYMLHTSFISKMSFWWWSTMEAADIKAKLQYIPGLEYLYARITPDQLDLPDFVLKYDNETYGVRYYTSPEGDL